MPAVAHTVEALTPHEHAVAVEVDPNLVAGAALRASPLLREGRERRDVGASASTCRVYYHGALIVEVR